MAELYLASLAGQGGFRKFVALKRVLPSIASNEDFRKMFLDEARITASLSHAGIAQVFELAEDPNTKEPVLAMEFVAGQNLEQIVKRAKKRGITLPIEFIARMANDLLLALHYAHGFIEPSTGQPMPVVHRDINPRNVMITYSGGTKIIDFGIAKARGRLNETSAGFVKGTLQYMAPEQVTAKNIDGRADLFATSVILYELLSGRILFDAPSPAAVMSKVMHDPIPDLGELVPSLPDALADAVMKGLDRDREGRWQSGREYARALDRAIEDSFDDQQMADVMSSLFEDKIVVTRELLSSAEGSSPADLKLMTMMGDEESVKEERALASDVVPQPTAVARPPGRKPTSELKAQEQPLVKPQDQTQDLPMVPRKPTPVLTPVPRRPTSEHSAQPRKPTSELPQRRGTSELAAQAPRKPTAEQLAANERTEMNLEPIKGPRPSAPAKTEDENPFSEDGDRTVAGVQPAALKKKPKSQPNLAPEPEPQTDPTTVGKAAKKGNDVILYVVLAVLALVLLIGAIFLFKSDSPEETRPIDPSTSGPAQKRRK